MTFKNAQQSRLLASYLNVSGYATKVDGFGFTIDMLDVTTLIDTAKKFIPGMSTSECSVEMLLDTDTTTGGQWDMLTSIDAGTLNPAPVTFAPAGLSASSECFLISAISGSFETKSTNSDKVTASYSAQATGPSDAGVMLDDVTSITSDTSGTARDGGAATTNGGVAHLHVVGFAGLTSDVIIIEQSATGVGSWSTLVTFATVTGLTSQRVEIAAGTPVARYLRVGDDVTGTGNCDRAVAFARR